MRSGMRREGMVHGIGMLGWTSRELSRSIGRRWKTAHDGALVHSIRHRCVLLRARTTLSTMSWLFTALLEHESGGDWALYDICIFHP